MILWNIKIEGILANPAEFMMWGSETPRPPGPAYVGFRNCQATSSSADARPIALGNSKKRAPGAPRAIHVQPANRLTEGLHEVP